MSRGAGSGIAARRRDGARRGWIGGWVRSWRARRDAQRARAVLAGTPDALLTVDARGTIDMANPAAARLLDYRPAALTGLPLSAILALRDDRRAPAVYTDQVAHRRDGSALDVDVALAPRGDGGLIVSLRDMAERRRVERAKDELLSTISHELRLPLTSVIGSLTLLRTGAAKELTPEMRRLIDIADSNSRRLVRLINDLLDIDRMEAGRLAMLRAPLDLRRIVDRARFDAEPLAAEADVMLATSLPAAGVTVAADAERLLQVIGNLLSNAIHVAPAGSRVLLSVVAADGHATVCVEDRGPGIPSDLRDRIFDRFESRRVGRHGSGSGSGSGSGLGLAIAREIVQRHDGTIRCEDRAGGGTRFAFTLPLLAEAAA